MVDEHDQVTQLLSRAADVAGTFTPPSPDELSQRTAPRHAARTLLATLGAAAVVAMIAIGSVILWTRAGDTTHPGTEPPVTVTGRLITVGGPAGTKPRPLSGTVTLENLRTHQQVTATADANGRYTTTVIPGTYNAYGQSAEYAGGQPRACSSYETTKVTAPVTIDVYCEQN